MKFLLPAFFAVAWLFGGPTFSSLAQETMLRDGGIDLAFQTATGEGASDRIHCAALAADGSGKVLLGGWFTTFDGRERWRLARIAPDGRLDVTFDPGDGPGTEPIQALTTLPDGGLIVVGAFRRFAEKPRRLVACLRADGSLDERFDATDALTLPLPPPKRNSRARSRLGELSGPPAAEQKPVDGLRAVALLPMPAEEQGNAAATRVLLAGEFADGVGHLACLDLRTGAADPNFRAPEIPAGGVVEAVAVQPDGKILLAGRFENVAGEPRARVARLEADGHLDRSFQPGAGANGDVLGVGLTPAGAILVWVESEIEFSAGFESREAAARLAAELREFAPDQNRAGRCQA